MKAGLGPIGWLMMAVQGLQAAWDYFAAEDKKKEEVLCIEHHSGILSRADYLVELGPGAGEQGGRITYSGPPVSV